MITEEKEIFLPTYPKLREIWDKHERTHWIPDEADVRHDVEQWKTGTISNGEKEFIKMILRLFTQSDTDICGAYVNRLLPVFKHPTARMMLLGFAARECTHMVAYKRLNDTLGYDSDEFMTEFLEYQAMREKHEYILEKTDMSTNEGIAKYLVKQTLCEGVSLFAQFAMLLAYALEGKLPGMVSVNKWSIVDESMHANGLTELLSIHVSDHPEVVTDDLKRVAYETARKIIALEDNFIDLCFNVHTPLCIPGGKEGVKKYIRYVCDYRMMQMGFKAQFDVNENPFEWIDKITGNTLGNFFESTVVEYSKGALVGEWGYDF